MTARPWLLYDVCPVCGVDQGNQCASTSNRTYMKTVHSGRRKIPQRYEYEPKPTASKLARLVIDVMNVEGLNPYTLAKKAGRARTYAYNILYEDKHPMTKAHAEVLLGAMGYTLQFRAVKTEEIHDGDAEGTVDPATTRNAGRHDVAGYPDRD